MCKQLTLLRLFVGFRGLPGPSNIAQTQGPKGDRGLPGDAGQKGDSGLRGSDGLSILVLVSLG